MTAATDTAAPKPARGWALVGEQELRDLWLGGRAAVLSVAFSLLMSVVAYMVATNQALNFLEQRESVNLTLQVAVAVGALLVLMTAADSISGERERSTLEALLLTPVSRYGLVGGKMIAALSLWLAAFAISVPYVWFLGRGIGLVDEAVVAGFVVGTMLAVFLASVGIVISTFAGSNRLSLSVSLFLLIVLFAPTQLPASAKNGWLGELLLRINPITGGEHYIGRLMVNAHGWTDDFSWLVSPIVASVVGVAVAAYVGGRHIRLGKAGDG
jgi:ABC-2 type transport system permease protein